MLDDETRSTIAAAEYPLTTEELIELCGESELAVPEGSECVADALSRLGSETFERPEDARFAVFTGVSAAAIGRRGYSDRDPDPPGTDRDPVSF
jgi:hypothetical protein